MKSKIQSIIVAAGIVALVISIRLMLEIQTMILPSWFLAFIYVLCTLCISFILGYLVKKIIGSNWKTLTFASIFLIIFCSIFYIREYKPTQSIIIPESYVGEVRLLVSNENKNDFIINKFGIGYIDKKTFDNGLYPKVIKGKKDITNQIKEYGKGALATTNKAIYSYEYISFFIPTKSKIIEELDIEELIKIKAIDTTRLFRK